MFLQELKNFSKQNWWIYSILIIVLAIVAGTGKGNLVEIIGLFIINLLANVAVMAAIGNYSEKKNKIGAIFHITSTSLFTILSLYSFFVFKEPLYLVWQICFLIAAIKAITFYNLEKDLKFFNSISLGFLNLIFLICFLYFDPSFNIGDGIPRLLTGLGFCFTTTGLVSTNDRFRYWGNYIGSSLITIGSCISTYISYTIGNLNGVSLGYFILTLTAFVYFSKLLPKYIKRNK